MSVSVHKQSDGYDLIEVVSRKGSVLTLSQFGAGMYSFLIEGKQMLAAPKDYLTYAHSKSYYGKFVGPIAGRIENGNIVVGEKACRLPINEGSNSLHSGSLCYAFSPFEYEIKETDVSTTVIFAKKFSSCFGQYNANVDASISYTLDQENDTISIVMSAIPDIAAPINLTNHAYFCLGQESIYPCLLKLRQKEVAVYHEGMLLARFEKPLEELDFSKGKTVGKDILAPSLVSSVGGLDHAFLLEEGEAPQATLIGKDYVLEVTTDAPCFQIYATNYPVSGQKMLLGNEDSKGSGITFEPVSRMDESLMCDKNVNQIRNVVFSFKRKGEEE